MPLNLYKSFNRATQRIKIISTEKMPGLAPLDLLREELSSSQMSVRINAIHRISIVATLIGEEGVKQELIPYLESLLNTEDDEVLYAIAKVLGSLFPDYTKHYEILVPILENLASFEETVVREEAVKSMINIANKLTPEQNASCIIPCVLRLANGNWFTNRVSAIHVMSAIYDKAGVHQDTLRKKFTDMINEETPMIRRAIASQLGVLSEKMDSEYFLVEMMPQFKNMSTDDQDSVRILCIESLIRISKNLSKEMNKSHMIPILIKLTRDKAWKVRTSVAKNFARMPEAMGKEITDNSLINIFSTLLQDPEGEVRTAAVVSFAQFVKEVSPSKLTSITIQMLNLLTDTLPLVRAGAAENLAYLSKHITPDILKTKVLPALLSAMKQEQDDEVKIELVQTLKNCGLSIGQEFFRLVPQIEIGKFMMETNWRVRKATLEMITELAQGFKTVELFEVYLQEFFFKYFTDEVHSVRDYGNQQLHKILKIENANWVTSTLLPKIEQSLSKDKTYLKRSAALYALEVITQYFPGPLRTKIVQMIADSATDTVPNIRMIVAKIANNIYDGLEGEEKSIIKKSISTLAGDKDRDVREKARIFIDAYGS